LTGHFRNPNELSDLAENFGKDEKLFRAAIEILAGHCSEAYPSRQRYNPKTGYHRLGACFLSTFTFRRANRMRLTQQSSGLEIRSQTVLTAKKARHGG
jgi:hypothetical protein